MAFSGFIDVSTALASYTTPSLVSGDKPGPWITIGGGNDHGKFTVEAIQ